MKYLSALLCVVAITLASGAAALAGECVYKPYVRDNHVVGTMVVNEFGKYCGYGVKQQNGIRLYIDNEGSYEHFSNQYAFDDVLKYLCSKCAYELPGKKAEEQ